MDRRILSAVAILLVCLLSADPSAAAVGRTPGAFQVTPKGAASYTIPLWTPPGMGQLNQKMALSYSSSGGNGLLGIGWSVAGLSSITRCPATKAQNPNPAPIKLLTSDKYCLDGNQIMSGRTEFDTFARITATGTAGNGPQWFNVEGKDGLIYEYGNSADSRLIGADGSTVLVWALTLVRDRNAPYGNSIQFHYTQESGTLRIDSISYPHLSTGLGPFHRVRFVYEDRPANDVLSGYIAGLAWQQNKRVDNIVVEWNNQLSGWAQSRRYELTYDQDPVSNRSRLTNIQECVQTNCLSATSVTYQPTESGWHGEESTGQSVASPVFWETALLLDVNGDGRDDVLYTKPNTPPLKPKLFLMLANDDGFAAPSDTGLQTAYLAAAQPIDLNGDLRMDLLIPGGGAGYGERWLGFISNGSGFVVDDTMGFPDYGDESTSGVPTYSMDTGEVWASDYNGDGYTDLVLYNNGRLEAFLGIGRGSDFGFLEPNSVPTEILYQPSGGWVLQCPTGTTKFGSAQDRLRSEVRQGDVNGDGVADFLVQECKDNGPGQQLSYRWRVLATGNGALTPGDPIVSSTGTPVTIPALVDVNGDGMLDFLWSTGAGSWQLATGRGNGTFVHTQTSMTVSDAANTRFADVDGDGRTDALAVVSGNYRFFRSTGSDFVDQSTLGIPVANTENAKMGDINGDGRGDWLYTTSLEIRYRLHKGVAAAGRATAITDGFGIGHRPQYMTLVAAADEGLYTRGTSGNFLNADYQGPAVVVTTVSSDSGAGSFTQSFQYTGAVINRLGRGFLGFASITTTDSRLGLHTTRKYGLGFPLTGLLKEEEVRQPDNSRIIRNTTNTLNTYGSAGDVQYAYIRKSVTVEREVGGALDNTVATETTVDYTVDSYGNVTDEIFTRVDKSSSSPTYMDEYKKRIERPVEPHVAQWCLSVPEWIRVTESVTGKTPVSQNTDLTVDYARCRVTGETTNPGSVEVVSTFGFDDCGNVSSVTKVGKKAGGTSLLDSRNEHLDFGSRCLAPVSMTNAEGETTGVDYRADLDLPRQVTDPNSTITATNFDVFGRVSLSTLPDGTDTQYQRGECTSAPGNNYCGTGNSNARWKVTKIRRDPNDTAFRSDIVIYDRLDRPLVEKTALVTGAYSTTEYHYDQLGRVTRVDLPYTSVSEGHRLTTYDVLGRVVADGLYSGTSEPFYLESGTTWQYAGRLQTETNPRGHDTVRQFDLRGSLVAVTDPPDPNNNGQQGGTTTYSVDPAGQVLSITDSGAGAVTSWVYNVNGHVTSISVPGAGTRTFGINSFGEMESQLDAKGQTTTYTYDKLSRPKARVEPGQTTNWTWGSSATDHNIGRLYSVSGSGYSEQYGYDAIGRLSVRTISADGTHQYNYEYDQGTGLIGSITYPASTSNYRLKVQNLYNFGIRYQVRDGNSPATVFWELNDVDSSGRATQEVLGGGTAEVTSGYSPITGLLEYRMANVGGQTRQDVSFHWDSAGNLASRVENLQGITETFEYDVMNRMWRSKRRLGNYADTITDIIVYNRVGNQLSSSAAGVTYNYQAGRPYSPTSVSDNCGSCTCAVHQLTYDANGNQKFTITSGTTDRTIDWTSYDMPSTVIVGSSSSTFSYTPDRKLWKQNADYSGTNETTLYLGGLMEKMSRGGIGGITEYRHYIPAGEGGFALYVRRSNNTSSTYFLTRDHLGSPSLMLDSSGATLANLSFAAFGSRRRSTWQDTLPPADYLPIQAVTREGFTGHQQLDNLALVHMGGRVYDPQLRLFLSPDRIVDGLGNSQGINRYAYVHNNPLRAIDPTGFMEEIVSTTTPYVGPTATISGPTGIMIPPAVDNGEAAIAAAREAIDRTQAERQEQAKKNREERQKDEKRQQPPPQCSPINGGPSPVQPQNTRTENAGKAAPIGTAAGGALGAAYGLYKAGSELASSAGGFHGWHRAEVTIETGRGLITGYGILGAAGGTIVGGMIGALWPTDMGDGTLQSCTR